MDENRRGNRLENPIAGAVGRGDQAHAGAMMASRQDNAVAQETRNEEPMQLIPDQQPLLTQIDTSAPVPDATALAVSNSGRSSSDRPSIDQSEPNTDAGFARRALFLSSSISEQPNVSRVPNEEAVFLDSNPSASQTASVTPTAFHNSSGISTATIPTSPNFPIPHVPVVVTDASSRRQSLTFDGGGGPLVAADPVAEQHSREQVVFLQVHMHMHLNSIAPARQTSPNSEQSNIEHSAALHGPEARVFVVSAAMWLDLQSRVRQWLLEQQAPEVTSWSSSFSYSSTTSASS